MTQRQSMDRTRTPQWSSRGWVVYGPRRQDGARVTLAGFRDEIEARTYFAAKAGATLQFKGEIR